MAKAKSKKSKRVRKQKFNLGLKALTRALLAARAEAERSIVVGTQRVAAAKKAGNKEVLKSNRLNLAGARSARRYFGGAVTQLGRMDCLDQWMNCDPEYF